jgi:hypothetical protein
MTDTHCSFDRNDYTFTIGPVTIHGLTRDPTMMIFEVPSTRNTGRMDLGFGKRARCVDMLRKLSRREAHKLIVRDSGGGAVMIGLAWISQITAKGRIVTIDISDITIADARKGGEVICPLIDRECIGADCEMWGEVGAVIDPEWQAERKQQREERAAKSWWWRFCHPEPQFGPLPRTLPVMGCTLKRRG